LYNYVRPYRDDVTGGKREQGGIPYKVLVNYACNFYLKSAFPDKCKPNFRHASK